VAHQMQCTRREVVLAMSARYFNIEIKTHLLFYSFRTWCFYEILCFV
jgi:hypothetical protein